MSVTFDQLLDKPMEVYNLNGVRAAYVDLRISRKSLPEGIYLYDVRDTSDDGGWYIGNVEDFVLVNHAGTFITTKPLTMLHPDWLSRGVYLDLSDNNEPFEYLGGIASLRQFIEEERG